MDFKPGDVVTLKSGGAAMTIESTSGSEAHCVWQVDAGGGLWETRREVFGREALMSAGPSAPSDGAAEDDPDYKVYEEGDD